MPSCSNPAAAWRALLWFGCLTATVRGAHAQRAVLPPPYAIALAEEPAPPPVPREFRGVWIATVGNMDWPSKPGLPVDSQRAELVALLDRAQAARLNAVIFQVRPAADAMYRSQLEPWSEYLAGRMGRPPQPFYDPLEFAVREAHRRGLELHAWFNPFRARYRGATSPTHPRHVSRTLSHVVKRYGPYRWMDPGEPAARAHAIRVILDVVNRYDIDGVHIDDYFYPYPERDRRGNTIPFPDDVSWQRYRRGGGTLSRDDWRRQNVDTFVDSLYRAIKSAKPWVKFGISPFGIWRPGFPTSVTGLDAYSILYADSRRWLREGWVDYFTPQLYWDIASPGQSYTALLEWWALENIRGRHLWIGNAAYKVNSADGSGWSANEIAAQIVRTREQPGASGNVYFNMSALLASNGSLAALLSQGPYSVPALVPASPWLVGDPPARPSIQLRRTATVLEIVLPQEQRAPRPRSSDPRFWVVRARYVDIWRVLLAPGDSRLVRLAADSAGRLPDIVAVSAVDRRGVESETAIHDLSGTSSR
ncbi:MAG TPA: family 10 glycosylhydrolase [Gemmatimonadaceae bacterium]|nr:family 10 glycosylhydrolase [Gemmatimonadaceae bacterium]